MSIQLEPVRGMRDILPPDSEGINVLVHQFQYVAELYGYRYIIPPTVELFKLFAIKSGPEISKSMYVFSDKAGREVCLRPEFTASIARIYLKYLRAEPKPIKIYYIGSAFRYEEPQFARYREFIQAGVEYIGDSSIYSDLEQLMLLRDYYARINLKDYAIKLGSVDILRTLLSGWGVPEKVQEDRAVRRPLRCARRRRGGSAIARRTPTGGRGGGGARGAFPRVLQESPRLPRCEQVRGYRRPQPSADPGPSRHRP